MQHEDADGREETDREDLAALDAGIDEDSQDVEFSAEDDVSSESQLDLRQFGQAVLWGTDWTVETIIAQMKRGNIEIDPQFQRRDAWKRPSKGSFIESLILGLPIPQVVLAEKKEERGSFIILDGKQRLLSILQFAGLAPKSTNNAFALSGLEVRRDLIRKKFKHFEQRPELRSDLNALLSHTIRAVVIRNWPSMAFLHVVFHRLNSGSLKLSPQELRQALLPGEFTKFADNFALESGPIHRLLKRRTADPRMRDTELLVRYLSFKHFLRSYEGRMRDFLDASCARFNKEWAKYEPLVQQDAQTFVQVIDALELVFGEQGIARRMDSTLFNRSIFDPLAFYATDQAARQAMVDHPEATRNAYAETVADEEFQNAVESDTAGIPHTEVRFRIMGERLQHHLHVPIAIPATQLNDLNQVRFVM